MVGKYTWGERIFAILNYTFLAVVALLCLFPFWIMVVASFTDDKVLRKEGYLPWITKFSLEAFKYVFNGSQIRTGYEVTIFVKIGRAHV